jgi:hypothetical protein
MEQLPETLVCPFCGNVNPFTQENCIKCKKPLGPIREAMESGLNTDPKEAAAVSLKNDEPSPLQRNIEPPPPLPEFTKEYIGTIKFQNRNSFLIRGAANRDIEIAARFFKRLAEKDIKNISLSTGELSVNSTTGQQESRDYYFIKKYLDERTFLLMAIRIAPVGSDLYVEWRHYYYRKPAHYNGWWWLIIPFWGGLVYTMFFYNADDILIGFQPQEDEMFELSIRATLEEAIDLAGISKTFIQDVGKEGNKDQRVI